MIWWPAMFSAGLAVGALVERWRWLRSECAKHWTRTTGEREKLL